MPVQVQENTAADELWKTPELTKAAEVFLSSSILAQEGQDFSNGVPFLYVAQGEGAYSFTSDPLALVSDDATTCCIVTLANSTKFLLAHVDSTATVEYLFEHWTSTTDSTEATQVYVVGGYEDEDGTGNEIVEAIVRGMKTLSKPSHSFVVNLWVTGPVNTIASNETNPHTLPKARGVICIPKESGLAFHNIDFARGTYRGPEFLRRVSSCPLTPLHILKTEPSLVCTVGPYERVAIPASENRSYFEWAAQCAPDDHILSTWSTSPYAEGPKFVADMKARFQYALDIADKASTLQRALVFAYSNESKVWEPVEN